MLTTLYLADNRFPGPADNDLPFLTMRDGGMARIPLNGRTLGLVSVSHLGKAQAEDLLDWLEGNHARFQRVSCGSGNGFSVVYG